MRLEVMFRDGFSGEDVRFEISLQVEVVRFDSCTELMRVMVWGLSWMHGVGPVWTSGR